MKLVLHKTDQTVSSSYGIKLPIGITFWGVSEMPSRDTSLSL